MKYIYDKSSFSRYKIGNKTKIYEYASQIMN